MPNKLSKEEIQLLMKVGERIRFIRKEKSMTQADLVYKAEVHGNMVGRIERGERAATIIHLHKIAKALEIDITDLFQDPPE